MADVIGMAPPRKVSGYPDPEPQAFEAASVRGAQLLRRLHNRLGSDIHRQAPLSGTAREGDHRTHGAVTPADARTRAAEIISRARAGKDPAPWNRPEAKAPAMRELGKRFLDEYVSSHCKPSTAEEYRRSVQLFSDPRIGKRRVPDIHRSDLATLHHDMRETPYQANRTLGVLSKILNLAELWGLRPDGSNPCRHVKRFREKTRERFPSDAEYSSP